MQSNIEWLKQLQVEAADCRACPLNQLPYNPGRVVVGVGSSTPDYMFVGEAPGEREAITGVPFIGPAGQVLQRMLALHNFTKTDLYITNVAKHRPPSNRTPSTEEMSTCTAKFLVRQIDTLRPIIIVALGKVAAFGLAANSEIEVSLPKVGLRGLQFLASYCGREYPVFCTWHPSYCLRQDGGSTTGKATAQLGADLELIKNKVEKLKLLLGETQHGND